MIEQYPEEMLQLLIPNTFKITAGYILDLFKVSYSPIQSEKHQEETVMFYWSQFLSDCDDGEYMY